MLSRKFDLDIIFVSEELYKKLNELKLAKQKNGKIPKPSHLLLKDIIESESMVKLLDEEIKKEKQLLESISKYGAEMQNDNQGTFERFNSKLNFDYFDTKIIICDDCKKEVERWSIVNEKKYCIECIDKDVNYLESKLNKA